MIIDKEDCKQILQIDDSENDDEIELFIPIAQEDLVEYCFNTFADPRITYHVSEVSFVRGSRDTITDGQSEFVKRRFAAGMDIYVEANNPNAGIHELYSVAAGTLTLTSSNALRSMAYNDTDYPCGSARISMINWPRALRVVVARMVWYLINRPKPTGELSQNRDGVVNVYDRTRSYPREITQMADKYRRLKYV